jgi:hypothetical protein
MKHLQNAKTIELPGNRLGCKGGAAIVNNLYDKVKILNLANNKIGSIGLNGLIKWLD